MQLSWSDGVVRVRFRARVPAKGPVPRIFAEEISAPHAKRGGGLDLCLPL